MFSLQQHVKTNYTQNHASQHRHLVRRSASSHPEARGKTEFPIIWCTCTHIPFSHCSIIRSFHTNCVPNSSIIRFASFHEEKMIGKIVHKDANDLLTAESSHIFLFFSPFFLLQVIKRMAKSKAKQRLEAMGNWKVSEHGVYTYLNISICLISCTAD